MPPLVIAAAGALASYAAGAVIGATILGSTLLAQVVVGLIGAIVSAAVGALFSGGAKKPEAVSFQRETQDRLQNIRSPVAPRQVIFGTTRVGGPHTYVTSSGGGNSFIHVIIPLAGHLVAGIDDVWFNEDIITPAMIDGSGNVTSGIYSGFVRIRKFLGTTTQVADPDLITEAPGGEWTAAHRGRGVAYLYVRLNYSQDKFPGGLPTITAVVRGFLVYDPRDTLTKHSNNPALCILAYMRWVYGLEIASDEWVASWWIAQANLCDEQVQLSASPSIFQVRYTLDGAFTYAQNPKDIMEPMLTSCGGVITNVNGEYRLHAARYIAPSTPALTYKDLRGPVEIIWRKPRRELFNGVRGTYVDPTAFYQLTDFPPMTNPGYVTQDGGSVIWRDVEYPYTQDGKRSQRLAKMELERARQGIIVKWPAKLTALRITAMDTVFVTLPDVGWSSKVFRVIDWVIADDGGIDLILQEEAAGAYDWNLGEGTTVDPAPDTNFRSPFEPPLIMAGLAAFSGDAELDVQDDGTVVSRVRLAWTAVPDVFVTTSGGRIDVQFRETGAGTWRSIQPALGSDIGIIISDVADGVAYDFQVRPVNMEDVAGPWALLSNYMVLGKLAPPSNVDSFNLAINPDGVRKFSWTHAAVPADVRAGGGYQIRYFLGSTGSWAAMTPLHVGVLVSSPYETSDLAAGTYTFSIKAVDSSGNEAVTAVFISLAVLPSPPLAGALLLRDEFALGFPGTKVSCSRNPLDGILYADSVGGWAALPATWAALAATWDTLLPTAASIQYETPTIDLGADLLMKPIVTAGGLGTQTLEMKSWPVAGSEPGTWTAIAQATARYVRIRVTMTGASSTIAALQTIIDAPSISDIISDLNVATQATTAWFFKVSAGRFQIQPRNNIAALAQASIAALQNVGGAFTWELVSKNATANATWAASGTPPRAGFPIAEFIIRNQSFTPADATVDIMLRGPRG